jgi:hypothetical protein
VTATMNFGLSQGGHVSKPRGFARLQQENPEEFKARSARGGKKAHASGHARTFTKAEAKAAQMLKDGAHCPCCDEMVKPDRGWIHPTNLYCPKCGLQLCGETS